MRVVVWFRQMQGSWPDPEQEPWPFLRGGLRTCPVASAPRKRRRVPRPANLDLRGRRVGAVHSQAIIKRPLSEVDRARAIDRHCPGHQPRRIRAHAAGAEREAAAERAELHHAGRRPGTSGERDEIGAAQLPAREIELTTSLGIIDGAIERKRTRAAQPPDAGSGQQRAEVELVSIDPDVQQWSRPRDIE